MFFESCLDKTYTWCCEGLGKTAMPCCAKVLTFTMFMAIATAKCAFTFPCPQRVLPLSGMSPVMASSLAEVIIISLTCWEVSKGFASRIKAHTPAVAGDDMEVPERRAKG